MQSFSGTISVLGGRHYIIESGASNGDIIHDLSALPPFRLKQASKRIKKPMLRIVSSSKSSFDGVYSIASTLKSG